MFGVSFPELILTMAIVLIVFGPEKLPEVARTLGKLMGQLRKSSDEIRREFYNAVYKPAQDFERTLDKSSRNLISLSPEEAANKSAQPPAPASEPAKPDIPKEVSRGTHDREQE